MGGGEDMMPKVVKGGMDGAEVLESMENKELER